MLSVTIDARVLGRAMDGTQRHVLELTAALGQQPGLTVRALVAAELEPAVRSALQAAGVQLVPAGLTAPAGLSDIVHRPHQVDSPADLAVLAAQGRRLVITHQDTIAFETAEQFASPAAWSGYRQMTRMALLGADRVVFPSAHSRDRALAHHLVEVQRASVVPIGVDHPLTARLEPPAAPPARRAHAPSAHAPSPDLSTGELLLCLGADYEHKRRPFALEVVAELQRRHSWSGHIVLAGAHVERGSSREREAELLEGDADLRWAAVDLGPVSEAERRWLLEHARLVLHPSADEGFGLVPFEAAAHGVPCLWAAGTSLSEFLPDEQAAVVPDDAAATAERAAELLRDDAARAQNIDSIRQAAVGLTWTVTASRLAEVYGETLEAPPAPGAVLLRQDGVMQAGFSEEAVRLVGPHGLLPAGLQRPLLALVARRRLRAPLFAALKLGYRLGTRRTRRRRS